MRCNRFLDDYRSNSSPTIVIAIALVTHHREKRDRDARSNVYLLLLLGVLFVHECRAFERGLTRVRNSPAGTMNTPKYLSLEMSRSEITTGDGKTPRPMRDASGTCTSRRAPLNFAGSDVHTRSLATMCSQQTHYTTPAASDFKEVSESTRPTREGMHAADAEHVLPSACEHLGGGAACSGGGGGGRGEDRVNNSSLRLRRRLRVVRAERRKRLSWRKRGETRLRAHSSGGLSETEGARRNGALGLADPKTKHRHGSLYAEPAKSGRAAEGDAAGHATSSLAEKSSNRAI
ncbi:hypothetical protein MRX96_002849 [Rhipicephalus microplus]